MTMMLDGVRVPLSADLAASLPTAASEPRYVPAYVARERLEAAGLWDALIAALPMAKLMKVATLRNGLDAADPEVHDALTAIGADPTEILAP